MKKAFILLVLLLCGCTKDIIETKIEVTDNYVISINYPVTNIKKIDKQITDFIDNEYKNFKKNIKDEYNVELSELNIDFEYTISNEYISVNIKSYIYDALNKKESTNNLSIDTKKEVKKQEKESIDYKLQERYINPKSKIIALTFDDGPSYYTKKILSVLNRYNIKATFFVVGNKVRDYSDTLKEVLNSNCEIGNHTYNHKLLTRMSDDEFLSQINKTQEVIKQYTGFTPKIFRPSYGILSNSLKKDLELEMTLWNIDTLDWKYKNYKTIAKRAIKGAKDMGIILMHDTYKRSLNALPIIIEELLEQDYEFVTISEYNKIKEIRKNE